MNNKIYFHNKFILITDGQYQPSGNQIIVEYSEKNEYLLNEKLGDFLQQNDGYNLIIICNNINSCLENIKLKFKYIEAAGGLIEYQGEYILIYRLDKWDLPKGKIDPGESPSDAAIRECREECSVGSIQIASELPSTFHIYAYKGKFALKKTFWFKMLMNEKQVLIPQTEENITVAEWMNAATIQTRVFPNTYPAIKDILMDGIFNK